MSPIAPFAVMAGWGADRLLGEPPTAVHPVALFGSAMTRLEQHLYGDDRWRGVVYTAIGAGVGAAVGFLARKSAGPLVSTVVVSGFAMAGKMLESESRRVAQALDDGDLVEARQRVGMLVGRRTDELGESDIARAVIESLAENTTDAVIATMFWATIAGATGAASHRCINTMDAMVGHHNPRFERFGWASARLDDLANWLPARLTTGAVIIARPRRDIPPRMADSWRRRSLRRSDFSSVARTSTTARSMTEACSEVESNQSAQTSNERLCSLDKLLWRLWRSPLQRTSSKDSLFVAGLDVIAAE